MPDSTDDRDQETRRRLVEEGGRNEEPTPDADSAEVPRETIEAAERLTRLARRAVDDAEAEAYRTDRDDRLAEYGFRARVREEDARDVLVLHPEEWLEEGTVRLDRVEDTDRAVERTISGAGDADEFERVDGHNRVVVERVREEAGDVHAANADAFADYMGNHYVREVGSATEAEVAEFLAEYFPRNAFPSDEQREVVEESLRLVFDAAGRDPPPVLE